MSKYKTSINATAKPAPAFKELSSFAGIVTKLCKIMANVKKQNNLFSFPGLKQVG
jgi:hypothetical protein